jgi:hypothetical protein
LNDPNIEILFQNKQFRQQQEQTQSTNDQSKKKVSTQSHQRNNAHASQHQTSDVKQAYQNHQNQII